MVDSDTSANRTPPKVMVLVHEALYGGGTRQTFYILEELARQNIPAVLFSNTKDSWLGKQLEASQLPLSKYYNASLQRTINPMKELQVFCHLLSIIQKEKPDIILASGVKLIGLGCLAGWLLRVPKLFAIIRGQGAPPDSKLLKLTHLMVWLVARLGAKLITVCDYDRDDLVKRHLCPPENIRTVHNGTDLERYRPNVFKGYLREKFGLPDNTFIIGMVGRLAYQKRYDQFIEMMIPLCEKHPHVYGLLIGDGRDRELLQAKIDASGFKDRLMITGFLEDMPRTYADLDLSVLLTRYEGCANALLESAASGVPMLADDVCGNAEIIADGKNGYIIQPNDIAQASAYAEALIQSFEQRAKFSLAGRVVAEDKFDRKKQIAALVSLLTDWKSLSNVVPLTVAPTPPSAELFHRQP